MTNPDIEYLNKLCENSINDSVIISRKTLTWLLEQVESYKNTKIREKERWENGLIHFYSHNKKKIPLKNLKEKTF